jgi:hypothetical protein
MAALCIALFGFIEWALLLIRTITEYALNKLFYSIENVEKLRTYGNRIWILMAIDTACIAAILVKVFYLGYLLTVDMAAILTCGMGAVLAMRQCDVAGELEAIATIDQHKSRKEKKNNEEENYYGF